jgi:hypothetical protein
MSTTALASRVSPENILDKQVAGVFKGNPSGFNINSEVESCTVSFLYDHEEKYGSTIILYYKVKIDFPGLDYDINFLKPSDFEFMVSRDHLLNSYPSNFVLQAYSDHRNDYRAVRLKFGADNKLSAVQTAYGISGAATSAANWGYFSAYTCKI